MHPYSPQIAVPPQLSDVEPSWGSSCLADNLGAWDPPLALESAAVLEGPKPTPAHTTTSAPQPSAEPANHPTSTPRKTAGGGAGDPKPTTSAGDDGLAGAIAGALGHGTSKTGSPKADPSPTNGASGTESGGSGLSEGAENSGSNVSGGPASDPSGSAPDPGSGGSTVPLSGSGSNPGASNSDPNSNGNDPASGSGGQGGGLSSPQGEDSSGGSSSSGSPNTGSGSDNSESGSAAYPTTLATVGGQSIAADPSNSNNAIIGGQTLAPGQRTTVNGVPFSVGRGGVVVAGSSTISVPAAGGATPNAIATVGSAPVRLDPATTNAIIIGGQTLKDGQSTIIDNTPVAVSSGHLIMGGGSGNSPASTIAIPTPSPLDSGVFSGIGGQPIVLSSGHVMVGTTSLSLGQTTIDGTVVSVGASQIIVGSSTIPIPTSNPSGSALNFEIAGESVAVSSGHVVIDGSTLAIGEETKMGSVVVSAGATQAVVGSSTISFAAARPFVSNIGGEAVVVSSGHVLIGGSTLDVGRQTTIDGTVVSAGASDAVVGSTTFALPAPAGSSSVEISSTDSASSSSGTASAFTGSAPKLKSVDAGLFILLAGCIILSIL